MSSVLPPPPTRTITPDDFLRPPDRGRGDELVDGELKERNVIYWSAFIGRRVSSALAAHVEPRGLGWVNAEGTSFRCFPDDENRIRRADVTFHRLDRLTPEQAQA